MENVSLLVHRVNNNIENVEVLLEEDNLDKEVINLIGKIIDEQMNNILQNSELYYLEDDCIAKNKDKLFLFEYINYIKNQMLINDNVIVKMVYKNKKVEINLEMLKKILKYLLSLNYDNIDNIYIEPKEDELHIKINFEKNKEHSLQSK